MEETQKKTVIIDDESEEDEEENGDWEDWREDDDNGEKADNEEESEKSRLLCLFCCSKYGSCDELFEHCRLFHKFDFQGLRKAFGLDFYGSLKLVNYVRSQVAENRCWTCGITCQSNLDLQSHLHEALNVHEIKLFWDDDRYLKPFMQDDTLLYSFSDDEEGEDDYTVGVDKEELIKDLGNIEEITINDDNTWQKSMSSSDYCVQNARDHVASATNGHVGVAGCSKMLMINGGSKGNAGSSCEKHVDMHSKASLMNLAAKDIKKINENYFGAYSSFGIHREMISDKVRMEAYRQAVLKNPSLLTGAVVMDVGCGTGILSLFAALAGASRVIAVEASEKMAAIATQIAKDNFLWRNDGQTEGDNQCSGVVDVVQGMVEELEKSIQIEPHSVDVLLSEWMGYCLLYESMLNSVLHARDKWLKPGGAILPDIATIYAVGFGRGGTSLPFWEDVYGFNMSCIGKELVQDAAQVPIVDIMDASDLVTDAVVLQVSAH
uniref:Arginine N-methyltransferase family protein n=1 Tax=Rhizophora mucronata TaxID=61149 RepID=A0A2P2LE80_RHIMU